MSVIHIYLMKIKNVIYLVCTKCGGPYSYQFPYNRIIGGFEVPPHSRPFQVVIFAFSTSGRVCGGSLISPNYVLTAAHCTQGFAPASVRVNVGEHNRSLIGDGEQYIYASNILVHPLYDSITLAYDYSIIRLSSSVVIPATNAFTGIACLPLDINEQFVGTNLTVSGWGRFDTKTQSYSNVSQATFMTSISNTQCAQTFAIGPYTICAFKSGTTTCFGDDGGNQNLS
jgi:trypsin